MRKDWNEQFRWKFPNPKEMKGVLAVFALCLLCVAGDQLNVWPLPVTAKFKCSGAVCSSVLKSAFERYQDLIFFADKTAPSGNTLESLSVRVTHEVPLEYGVDESYKLFIDQNGGELYANTEWGALSDRLLDRLMFRGLETFSQLVEWNSTHGGYAIHSFPIDITDKPRFSWRGLLIDTSRHYLPLRVIRSAIDGKAYRRFPNLSHAIRNLPTPFPEGVLSIIEYGRLRGVRIVAEFDSPGHAYPSWDSYPDLFPPCSHNPVFDATNNYTYHFMEQLLKEMTGLFTDEYFHLGGDEVQYTCWQSVPAIQQWMSEHSISTFADLQGYYEQRLQNITLAFGKTPIYWDEVFGNAQFPLDLKAVIHVWNSPQSEVINVVQAGYRALYSTPWYLDRQVPTSNTWYLWEDTWKSFYVEDPVGNDTLSEAELARILGGEACMWGEQVDESVFDGRVWPRAAAVGERLWSLQSVNSIAAATPRLGTQRCRMLRRHIQASPIYPDYCALPEE